MHEEPKIIASLREQFRSRIVFSIFFAMVAGSKILKLFTWILLSSESSL